MYDLFISHASEDKDEFVRPLAISLIRKGWKVWYDELSLKVGKLPSTLNRQRRDTREAWTCRFEPQLSLKELAGI